MPLSPALITFLRYPREAPPSWSTQSTDDPAPIAVSRADISRSHGITPAVIMLDIVPVDPQNLAVGTRHGELVVEYDGARLSIPNCVIDASSVSFSPNGRIHSLSIFDRRWKWQYGSVSGHYNRRTETGKLIVANDPEFRTSSVMNSQKTPQELATILLNEMGETNFDVSPLPEGTGPEVKWEDDNPARELAQLCEMFGCRVVYGWDDRVRLFRIGQSADDTGENRKWANRSERAAERRAQRLARLAGTVINPPLPNPLPVIRYSEAIDIEDRPDSITIATGPILHQWDFELEAVGEDTDGSIKLVKDLSFAPFPRQVDGGWGGEQAAFSLLHGANLDTENMDLQELARKTIFKWYRIKVPFAFPDTYITRQDDQDVQVSLRMFNLADIKPIVQHLATTSVEDGLIVDNEPIVYGRWCDLVENNVAKILPLPKTVEGTVAGVPAVRLLVPAGYSIDGRKGIVKFREPMAVYKDPDFKIFGPAELRLRASFFHRDDRNGAWRTYHVTRDQPLPHIGTKSLVIKRDDLTPVKIAVFGDTFEDVRLESNLEEIQDLASEHINAIERTFFPSHPTEIVLAGFYPQIELDGVIRTVSFAIDSADTTAPITTMVQIDQDVPGIGQLAYVELRQHERILALRDQAAVLRRIDRATQGIGVAGISTTGGFF